MYRFKASTNISLRQIDLDPVETDVVQVVVREQADRRHFDLNVDAIEERAGDAGTIALDLQRRADAFFLRVGEKAAGARVHRGDQHDTGGIIDRAEGAGDGDVAVFQRLPHDLEDVAPEFRQLVEEQDTVTVTKDIPILVLQTSVRPK